MAWINRSHSASDNTWGGTRGKTEPVCPLLGGLAAALAKDSLTIVA
jgi:hypothetical protein